LGCRKKCLVKLEALKRTHKANMENGGRAPKADYLSRVAERGVDLLYVLTGAPTPAQMDNLSQIEEKVLGNYRAMFKEDQDAIHRLTSTLAEHSSMLIMNGKSKL